MMSMAPGGRVARERLLDAAGELFYEHGFHAVGVDRVIERAGVAKTTLYRHFPSKDELIIGWLARANEQFLSWFDDAATGGSGGRGQLARLFEAVEELATSPQCLGCTFQVSAAEFPDHSHPVHAVARDHKQAVRARLQALASDAGARDASGLADELLLLMDGAFASARMYGPVGPAAVVAQAASTLITNATRSTATDRRHDT